MKQAVKKWISLLLCLGLLALPGCSDSPSEPVNTEALFATLLQQVDFATELSDAGEDATLYFPEFPVGTKIQLFIGSGYYADEAVLITLGDPAHKKAAQAAVEEHLAQKRQQFLNYIPEEVSKIDQALTWEDALHILLCITGDRVTANHVLENAGESVENEYVDLLIKEMQMYAHLTSGKEVTGFPGQSYSNDENHDAVVDGTITATEDSFLAEVASWQTKRERGEGYVMGTGVWAQQMDKFQTVFTGKTVEEIEAWFAAYCSDRNGRPLKAGSSNEQDAAKYDALTDDAKAMLADVTSSATMSLNDGHGNILGALEKAYANRVEIELTIGK